MSVSLLNSWNFHDSMKRFRFCLQSTPGTRNWQSVLNFPPPTWNKKEMPKRRCTNWSLLPELIALFLSLAVQLQLSSGKWEKKGVFPFGREMTAQCIDASLQKVHPADLKIGGELAKSPLRINFFSPFKCDEVAASSSTFEMHMKAPSR